MDFDEYDYLEKTSANPELSPSAAAAGNGVRSDEKDRSRHRSSKHRSDTNNGTADRDSSHGSKRSRSDKDAPRDPERHRDRVSSRHGSRDERNGKDRERERERPERERPERERVRERERPEERARHSSRSRSERHQEEERERPERNKEMVEAREKEKEREPRERDQNPRRYKEKKEEAAEPEADPERDQRTVFAYQIALKADERDVYEFFSRAGKVRDVRLIMDRNSRRSKGVGYIEFYESLSVPMAIALSGQLLFGQPVMVKPSEAEKNLVQSSTAVGGLVGPYSGGARRLYIGNLHFNITEEQLRLVLEPFGPVELVQLPRETDTGHCKGYGFVQFARLEDARAALSLNGQLEIAGRSIKVSAVTDQVGMLDVGTNAGDFDDDEGGGLSLNARSRAMLMQKLDRSGSATSITGALVPSAVNACAQVPPTSLLGVPPLQPTVPAPIGLPTSGIPLIPAAIQPIETVGVPSECLLLKNMFDPNAETEPDFDLDIKEDVGDECSKFGTVKHIFVDKNSAGHVYLRFDSASSAMGAQRALHGRWFAGKMILATFMLPQNYEAKFPEISGS